MVIFSEEINVYRMYRVRSLIFHFAAESRRTRAAVIRFRRMSSPMTNEDMMKNTYAKETKRCVGLSLVNI